MTRSEIFYTTRLKDLTSAALAYLSQGKYTEAEWCRKEQLRVQELLRFVRGQTK
jgi:hypothetical protein